MPVRRGMLGVALALAIVPTQSALADQPSDPFAPQTNAARAGEAKALVESARTLPAPANTKVTISPGQAAQKLRSAQAATERKLATNPKQAAAEVSAAAQSLRKPGVATSPSESQAAASTSSTVGTPVWPTCYQANGNSFPCRLNTYNVPSGVTPRNQVMIIVASGGWDSSGQMMAANFTALAQAWAASGFQTYVIEHSQRGAVVNGQPSGVTATINVLQWYDLIKSAFPSNRVSMKGISSGGHLALLVAANRYSGSTAMASVLTEASPTDITTAATAYSPPVLETEAVVKAWGTNNTLRGQYSPRSYPFTTQGLIAHAVDDDYVNPLDGIAFGVDAINADWALTASRPGLVKWNPSDLINDGLVPSPGPAVAFGHSRKQYGEGLTSTSGQTYALKQIYLAANGQHI